MGSSSISLSRDTNDTTGRARTRVASLFGLLVATLAEVVGASMDDNGTLYIYQFNSREERLGGVCSYSDDAVGANKLDQLVRHRSLGVALAISLEVSEITDVAVLVGRGAVLLAVGVDYGDISMPGSSAIFTIL